MRGNAQPDGRPLGESELQYYFSPFVDQSTPNEVCLCGSVRSSQYHFPIDDAFQRYPRSSREIVRNRAEILFLGRQISVEGATQIFLPNFINLGHHRTRGKVW